MSRLLVAAALLAAAAAAPASADPAACAETYRTDTGRNLTYNGPGVSSGIPGPKIRLGKPEVFAATQASHTVAFAQCATTS